MARRLGALFRIGGKYGTHEPVELADRLQPMLIVMDVKMPKMNGIDAAVLIKAHLPHLIVIGLSVQAAGPTEEPMRRIAGAASVFPKESAVEELYRTIRMVMNEGLKSGESARDHLES
jgi:DNA-binding NarL/FixJ family response regulator